MKTDPIAERARFRVAMVDAARARGGAAAQFIAGGNTNLWLDIAFDAFAALTTESRPEGLELVGALKREREGCARTAQRYVAAAGSMTNEETARGVMQAIRARPALAAPRPQTDAPASGEVEARFWLIVHQPGMVPVRKGSWPRSQMAKVIREFIDANPVAYLHVLSVDSFGNPDVDHGPEVLQMLDGRSMSTGSKHNARTLAAHTPTPSEGARDSALEGIAARLIDQQDEPWRMEATLHEANQRLHYWRGKAINGARAIRALRAAEPERAGAIRLTAAAPPGIMCFACDGEAANCTMCGGAGRITAFAAPQGQNSGED